jgi:hypothetical protein
MLIQMYDPMRQRTTETREGRPGEADNLPAGTAWGALMLQ